MLVDTGETAAMNPADAGDVTFPEPPIDFREDPGAEERVDLGGLLVPAPAPPAGCGLPLGSMGRWDESCWCG